MKSLFHLSISAILWLARFSFFVCEVSSSASLSTTSQPLFELRKTPRRFQLKRIPTRVRLLTPSRRLKMREVALRFRPPLRFITSQSNSMSHYASSNPDSDHSLPSTAPSSLHACADEEHFEALQRDMGALVQGLMGRIKKQEDTDILLRAWSTRCETLESEVARLAKVVQQLEAEKAAMTNSLETKVSRHTSQSLDRSLISCGSPGARRIDFGRSPQRRNVPLVDSRDRLHLERHVMVSQSVHQASRACCPSNRPQQEHEVRPRLCPPLRRPSQQWLISPFPPSSKQDPPPCNAFYLVGGCSVPRCKVSFPSMISALGLRADSSHPLICPLPSCHLV